MQALWRYLQYLLKRKHLLRMQNGIFLGDSAVCDSQGLLSLLYWGNGTDNQYYFPNCLHLYAHISLQTKAGTNFDEFIPEGRKLI